MNRVGLLLLLAFGALCAPPGASGQAVVDTAAHALRGDPVYIDPAARPTITQAEASSLRMEISGAGGPILIALFPGSARDEVGGDANDVLRALVRSVGRRATYAVVVEGQFRAGSNDPDFARGEVPTLATEAFEAHQSDGLAATLLDFVRRVRAARASSENDGSLGGTEIALLAAGGGAAGLLYLGVRRRRRRDLVALKKAVKEDLVALGDEIRALDIDIEMPSVKQEARDDYGQALEHFEQAGDAFDRARRPEDLEPVTAELEEGRFAMACAKARLEGRLPPDRRPPCFFDPRHGPSVRDMEWTPDGGAPRFVPVCQEDAFALGAGSEPKAREVVVGRRRTPYWEASGFAPYAGGYFGGLDGGLLPGLLIGTALGSAIGAEAPDVDAADTAGSSSDFFDDDAGGGEGDFGGDSGGDFGGDFGGDSGGDFGGGDFGGGGNGGGNGS